MIGEAVGCLYTLINLFLGQGFSDDNVVITGCYAIERKITVLISDGVALLAEIQDAVVVAVNIDGDPTQAAFCALVIDPVAIGIFEFESVDRARGLKVPFIETGFFVIVARAPQFGVEIEIIVFDRLARIGVEIGLDQAHFDQNSIVVSTAARRRLCKIQGIVFSCVEIVDHRRV